MLSFAFPYKNLILQASLCLFLTLIVTFLKIPVRFLQGLFTYIHPDSVGQNRNNGVRAAIRRPESSDPSRSLDGYQNLSSRGSVDPRGRVKSKAQPEFDENNAQIFRLKLDEAHLQTRLCFDDYRSSLTCSLLALPSLLLQHFLDASNGVGILANGALVPLVLGFLGIFKALASLAKVSIDRSASRRSEKELSAAAGMLGFLLGLLICSGVFSSVLEFEIESIDGIGRSVLVAAMGFIASLLYLPATRCARSFWLGTDQSKWDLSMISGGRICRTVLYLNQLLSTLAPLLWIAPFAQTLVNTNISGGSRPENPSGLGVSRTDFERLRRRCALLSGLSMMVAVRPNLQMYLNEALLCWYQRLHAGRVPDMDYSRAKVFLHNHYLCAAALQFFAPSALMLAFLGLAGIESNAVWSAPMNEAALVLAWWVAFLWAMFTSASLLLHRLGIWYAS